MERLLKRLSMFLLCFMYLTGGGNGAITVAASETEKAQGKILTAEDFPPEVLEEAAAEEARLALETPGTSSEEAKSAEAEEGIEEVPEETDEEEKLGDSEYVIDGATYSLTYKDLWGEISITGWEGEASGRLILPNEIDGMTLHQEKESMPSAAEPPSSAMQTDRIPTPAELQPVCQKLSVIFADCLMESWIRMFI